MSLFTGPNRGVFRLLTVCLGGVAGAGALLALGGSAPPLRARPGVPAQAAQEQTPPNPFEKGLPPGIPDEEVQKITCTQCHRRPTPDLLPRAMWHDEIVKMMFFRAKEPQPRGDLSVIKLPPDMAAALRYMEANAPERLRTPDRWPDVTESRLKFTSYGLSLPDSGDNPARLECPPGRLRR